MRKAQIAEFILSLFTSPERAASTVGDLIENAAARGVWWFWWDISRTALSLLWTSFRAEPLFMASIGFRGFLMVFFLQLLIIFIMTVILVPAFLNRMGGARFLFGVKRRFSVVKVVLDFPVWASWSSFRSAVGSRDARGEEKWLLACPSSSNT